MKRLQLMSSDTQCSDCIMFGWEWMFPISFAEAYMTDEQIYLSGRGLK